MRSLEQLCWLPIYYLVDQRPSRPRSEAAASPLGLPEHFTLENYIKALDAMAYGRALCNNLVITGCAVGLLLVFSSMAAYVIARSPRKVFQRMYSVFMVG